MGAGGEVRSICGFGVQIPQLRPLADAVRNAANQFIAGEVPEERHGTVTRLVDVQNSCLTSSHASGLTHMHQEF